jgi:Mor family transcriptional regulator
MAKIERGKLPYVPTVGRPSSERWREVGATYENGAKVNELAAKYNVDTRTIYRDVKRYRSCERK